MTIYNAGDFGFSILGQLPAGKVRDEREDQWAVWHNAAIVGHVWWNEDERAWTCTRANSDATGLTYYGSKEAAALALIGASMRLDGAAVSST